MIRPFEVFQSDWILHAIWETRGSEINGCACARGCASIWGIVASSATLRLDGTPHVSRAPSSFSEQRCLFYQHRRDVMTAATSMSRLNVQWRLQLLDDASTTASHNDVLSCIGNKDGERKDESIRARSPYVVLDKERGAPCTFSVLHEGDQVNGHECGGHCPSETGRAAAALVLWGEGPATRGRTRVADSFCCGRSKLGASRGLWTLVVQKQLHAAFHQMSTGWLSQIPHPSSLN